MPFIVFYNIQFESCVNVQLLQGLHRILMWISFIVKAGCYLFVPLCGCPTRNIGLSFYVCNVEQVPMFLQSTIEHAPQYGIIGFVLQSMLIHFKNGIFNKIIDNPMTSSQLYVANDSSATTIFNHLYNKMAALQV